MDRETGFDRIAFARRFSQLRGGWPQKYWAKWFGLSYAAVKDMAQGRVNPSRAVVLLITAIELSPGFMQDVAKLAKVDLVVKIRHFIPMGTMAACAAKLAVAEM